MKKIDRLYLALTAAFLILGIFLLFMSKTYAAISFILAAIAAVAFIVDEMKKHRDLKHKVS